MVLNLSLLARHARYLNEFREQGDDFLPMGVDLRQKRFSVFGAHDNSRRFSGYAV